MVLMVSSFKFPSNQSMVLICDSKCQRLFGSVPSTPMKQNCKWETLAVLKGEIVVVLILLHNFG
jgi:hypothetical protein